jgi:predicted type IV restriction endonuclease
MALETTLNEITTRLRQGKFSNEQAISQGIVLRLLQELGWDTWDTAAVWPEYQTGEGRADFALCHPPNKLPAVLIEVKQPGKAEDAVRQALAYAFHTGVPFVILTDGTTWSFYLPAEQGSYEDRRVYKLDLLERPPAEAAETLNRYLAHDRVVTGEALETARQEYRSLHRRSQARAAVPEVWKELVGKGNEELVELLSSNVELKTGIRPDTDAVAEFLAGLGRPVLLETIRSTAAERPTRVSERQVPQRAANETSRSGVLRLRGIAYPYNTAKDAMVIVLRELAKTDPSFLERCSQHPDAQGRKRRYIARPPEELFPDREDLRDMNERLGDGWFVNTNLNNVLKKTIIKMATEVAGLKFGSDVTVEF